jgi:hypothetical protein
VLLSCSRDTSQLHLLAHRRSTSQQRPCWRCIFWHIEGSSRGSILFFAGLCLGSRCTGDERIEAAETQLCSDAAAEMCPCCIRWCTEAAEIDRRPAHLPSRLCFFQATSCNRMLYVSLAVSATTCLFSCFKWAACRCCLHLSRSPSATHSSVPASNMHAQAS